MAFISLLLVLASLSASRHAHSARDYGFAVGMMVVGAYVMFMRGRA